MMTTALADSAIMLRRKLKHMLRYPSMTLFMVLMPVMFLLLFVYILGGTIGPAGHTGRAAYATFITPGILALTAVAATTATAVSIASDMTGGIIARFPHHAGCAGQHAGRPRRRRDDPDRARHGGRDRDRAAHRLPRHNQRNELARRPPPS